MFVDAVSLKTVIDCAVDQLHYGDFLAVRDHAHSNVKNNIHRRSSGPSGCGKSTVLRCLNRMNDLVRGFSFTGHVRYRGKDIYERSVDPVAVRRHIAWCFSSRIHSR